MKYSLVLLASLFLFFSCKNEKDNTNEAVNNEPVTEEVPTTDEDSDEISLANYNCFTVGNGVRMRSKADLKSEKVAELENGTLVKILEKTERKVISRDNDCNKLGYPWLKVLTATGQEGWIYGRYLHQNIEISKTGLGSYVNTEHKFDDLPYTFHIGKDFSYPVSDSDGLTGCSDYMMPYFYKKGETTIRPIFLKSDTETEVNLVSHPNRYWFFESSDVRIDNITRILPILYGVRMSMDVKFQEETKAIDTDIIFKRGKFYVGLLKTK
jgi:hypothetical protein